MNTLILNGSFDSNSASIIKTLENALTGKYKIIDLYSLESFSDESIDKYVRSCNCIILISPVIFGTVSGRLSIVISNMLYIPKDGISQNGLNRLKRLASFKKPEFYKAQAMRMSTYDKPRIISLADANDDYIMLPRGCREALDLLLSEYNCRASYEDKSFTGKSINVKFNGELRPDQAEAVNSMMHCDNGVIAATTAFGKTVAAIGLIAERKVNTLILVHTQALLQQWKNHLNNFLQSMNLFLNHLQFATFSRI